MKRFNLPVTANGFDVAAGGLSGPYRALCLTIRPETATVFGFTLGSAAQPQALAVAYDLNTQTLSVSGAARSDTTSVYYPLVNNALSVSLRLGDGATHLDLGEHSVPLPSFTLNQWPDLRFTADHGMVQVTTLSVWPVDLRP